MSIPARSSARERLLAAATQMIRSKGFADTSVDALCAAAGVTKGAFFHHFASKAELGVAAADAWSEMARALFSAAPHTALPDPRDRVLGYIDCRLDLIRGDLPDFTCLVGTMVQEVYASQPQIREACAASIFGHARTLVPDIEAAKALYAPGADWTAESLALHTQTVLQGAFILAKASGDAGIAADSVRHLRRYVALLLPRGQP